MRCAIGKRSARRMPELQHVLDAISSARTIAALQRTIPMAKQLGTEFELDIARWAYQYAREQIQQGRLPAAELLA
jgi:hypothetical protein